METPKGTKAGLVFWTPAPFRDSPGSSVTSEREWEDGDDEPAESDDDFASQMDENGIIGLAEALDGVEFAGRDPDSEAEGLASGEADAPHGGARYNLWEHLSRVSPRDDVQILSPRECVSEICLIPLKLTFFSFIVSLKKNHPTSFF